MPDQDEYLRQLVDDAEPEASASVTELALEMKRLKAEVDSIEESLKPIKDRYDYIRKKLLPDAMAEAGLKNIKLVEGGSVYVTTKVNAGVREDDRATFFSWLRDNGHGGLIQPSVHPATLTAWIKELKELNAPLPPMVNIYEEPMAVLRKS